MSKIIICSPISKTGHLDGWTNLTTKLFSESFEDVLVISNQWNKFRSRLLNKNLGGAIYSRRWEASISSYLLMVIRRLCRRPSRLVSLFPYLESVRRVHQLIRRSTPRSFVWHGLRLKLIAEQEGFVEAPVLLLYFDHYRMTHAELEFFDALFPYGWGALLFQEECLKPFVMAKTVNLIGLFSPSTNAAYSHIRKVDLIEEFVYMGDLFQNQAKFTGDVRGPRPQQNTLGFFGPLVERKGFSNFVKFASSALCRGWRICVFGEVFGHTDRESLKVLGELKKRFPRSVEYNLNFISSDILFFKKFDLCDVIWLGYEPSHTGSSNLLQAAIDRNKKVLISKHLIQLLGLNITQACHAQSFLDSDLSKFNLSFGAPIKNKSPLSVQGWSLVQSRFKEFSTKTKNTRLEVVIYGGSRLAVNFLNSLPEFLEVRGVFAKEISPQLKKFNTPLIEELSKVTSRFLVICSSSHQEIILSLQHEVPSLKNKLVTYPIENYNESSAHLETIYKLTFFFILLLIILTSYLIIPV